MQNAASIAGLLLTTEALIVEKKEPQNNNRVAAARRAEWAGCTKTDAEKKKRGCESSPAFFVVSPASPCEDYAIAPFNSLHRAVCVSLHDTGGVSARRRGIAGGIPLGSDLIAIDATFCCLADGPD